MNMDKVAGFEKIVAPGLNAVGFCYKLKVYHPKREKN
jgi:hypothetical protein